MWQHVGTCKNMRFRGTYRLHHRSGKNQRARKKVSSSYQLKHTAVTRRHIPEDGIFKILWFHLLSQDAPTLVLLKSTHTLEFTSQLVHSIKSTARTLTCPLILPGLQLFLPKRRRTFTVLHGVASLLSESEVQNMTFSPNEWSFPGIH
jgi:hypothetical protein